MTPILRRALFAALLAASWVAPAFCQSPPPDEPLDLSASPGLLPAELSYIQGLEGGRFALQGNFLYDGKGSLLLTNAAAEPILKARSQTTVAELRRKQEAGAIGEEERKEALGLYWYRSPLLSPEDQSFLASLNAAVLGQVPAGAFGTKAPGQLLAAGAGPGLSERFLRQVVLPDDPAQKTALGDAVSMLLATPTGRQLAEEFIATGAKARLSFIPFTNTQILTENGKKVLYGIRGVCDSSRSTIEVRLNQDFLKTDRAFYQYHLPTVLAHELLGHGLESVKAKKAGVWQAFNTYYRDNESNAKMVGWTVEAELGGKIHSSDMFSYLRDPEAYHRSLQITTPYYSTTVKPEESADMAGTLSARLQRTREELAAIPKNIASWESWRPIVEHFVSVHKAARDSFRSILEQIDNMAKEYLPKRTETLKSIVSHLESYLSRFQGQGGAAASRDLKAQFSNPFFAQEQARVAQRHKKLESQLQGRRYEPFSPPASDQVTWDKLKGLYAQDKKDHPEHWKK